jgi:hypothetical protein
MEPFWSHAPASFVAARKTRCHCRRTSNMPASALWGHIGERALVRHYAQTTILWNAKSSYCRKANAKSVLPAATAMYCLSPTA